MTKPRRIKLPRHPVDAFVVMAKAMGLPAPDPAALERMRALCDEPVTAEQAAVESRVYSVVSIQAGSQAAASLGRLGGLVSSLAKRRAVKANGRKGGRPKGRKDSYPRKRRQG